jgi:predicted DNA-binding transcriptional regulator AlpA
LGIVRKPNVTNTEVKPLVENETGQPKRNLLRLPEVEERVRIGRTSIYRGMRNHTFPRCIKMAGSSFWIESEIEDYIEALMSTRVDSSTLPALSAGSAPAAGSAFRATSSPAAGSKPTAGSASTAGSPPPKANKALPKRPEAPPGAPKPPADALGVTPARAEESARAIRALEEVQRSIAALVKEMGSMKADLAALRNHLGCRP